MAGLCTAFKLGSGSLHMVGCTIADVHETALITDDRETALPGFGIGHAAPFAPELTLEGCRLSKPFVWAERPESTQRAGWRMLAGAVPLGRFTRSQQASSSKEALGRPPRARQLYQGAAGRLRPTPVTTEEVAWVFHGSSMPTDLQAYVLRRLQGLEPGSRTGDNGR